MEKDLKQVAKRVDEQLKKLTQRLLENSKRVKRMENYASVQLSKAMNDLNNLPKSNDWMRNLLSIIDILGEVERFVEKIDDVGDIEDFEEISLEKITCQNYS